MNANVIELTVLIIVSVLIITAVGYMVVTLAQDGKEKNVYEELAEYYTEIFSDADDDSEERVPGVLPAQHVSGARLSVDFDALKEINKDIKGWLYISGTEINYPYVQTIDNNYYLDKSFKREKSKLGTIFLDAETPSGSSDVTILYGHNMGSGRTEMFSPLTRYDKEDFARKHSEIITLTADGRETIWEVFSVSHINTRKDELALYRKHGLSSKQQYDEYIRLIKSYKLFETGITPGYGQSILILSTCLGDGRNEMRRVVFAAEVIV